MEASTGSTVTFETSARPGAMLYDHTLDEATMARVRSGDHDVVVIQGQSREPIDQPDYGGYPNDPTQMTWALERGYLRAAAGRGDVVALVGSAFLLARQEHPDIVLYGDDGSHPSPAGTMLAACVVASALTSLPPRPPEPPPPGVDAPTAARLCALVPYVGATLEPCCELDRCAGACVVPRSDPAHCGACGHPCAAEEPCIEGECGCQAPLTACDLGCHDLTRSDLHCGACRRACDDGQACAAATTAVPASPWESIRPALAAEVAGCEPYESTGLASLACRAAAHAFCGTVGPCFDSGLPPTTGHSHGFESALCVRGAVHAVSYETLRSFSPSCDTIDEHQGQACVTAISDYCGSTGAVSGFGPVGVDGEGGLLVTCVDAATIVTVSLASISEPNARCVADPITCQGPARAHCEHLGYAGGFGPVAWAGGEVDLVCLHR